MYILYVKSCIVEMLKNSEPRFQKNIQIILLDKIKILHDILRKFQCNTKIKAGPELSAVMDNVLRKIMKTKIE